MQQHPYPRTGVTVEALNLVTHMEMEVLRSSLHQGQVPADLKAKLDRLRLDDPRELYLKQQALVLEWLLTSAAAQGFCRLGQREKERLVRMLAYVRKDDDAIPDTWPGGMVDDHDLMRVTCREFQEVLNKFKAWRLTHQVPALWRGATATAGVCALGVGTQERRRVRPV